VFGFLGTIRRDRVLLHLMSLTAIAEVLGFSHQALLPSLARDVLRVGPEGLGVMTAARQVGGLAASRSPRGSVAHAATVRCSSRSWSLRRLAGGTRIRAELHRGPADPRRRQRARLRDGLLAQTLIQLAVPSGLRGRAGGAWVVSIGMAPLGQFQVGRSRRCSGSAPRSA